MDDSRFEAFSALISSAYKSMQKMKFRGMERYDLGGTHTFCMRQLRHAPEGGLNRTELAARCEMDKAQISRIIAELSKKGYVTECGQKSAYRKKFVLTEQGKRVAEMIDGIVQRVLQFVSGEIPQEQIKAMYATLNIICENLKKAEDLPLDCISEFPG